MRRSWLIPSLATLAVLSATVRAALPATQPTMVKLFVEAEDPREAARQITRQLGLPLRVDPGAGVIQADGGGEKPFAAALADLLKQASLAPAENTQTLTLRHGESYQLVPLGNTALLAISRVNVSAQHSMASGNDTFTYSYDLQGTLFFDPALKVIGVLRDARADRVEADVPVLPPENGPGNETYQLSNALSGGEAPGRVSIRFSSRTPVSKIKSLGTRVRAVQVVEEAAVDVSADDLSGVRDIEADGIKAAISVDNPDPRRATLVVRLNGPVVERYQNQWMQALQRCVTAYDVNGDSLAIEPQGVQPDVGGKGVRLRFRPSNNPTFFEELAIVKVRLPTKVKTIDVPVELKNLELRTR